MVPNINPNGRSFRGAGAYHLHDKGEALNKRPTTSDRVVWTATRNLVNDDPEKAIDEMWRTAEDAAHLKQASGHEWRRRREAMPVKTMSLSWAPHQSPTREEMEATADSFLRHMGWQEHQALLIPHSDTAHPHLHIILNRVHPETGLVLNDWREQRRSQRWGDAYDLEQGLILCPVRFEKYEKGCFDLQPNGMPYPYAKLIQEQDRAFDNPLAQASSQDQSEKDLLTERHRQEREAFLASGKAQFRQARQAAYREVRDEFKPLWREHFKHANETQDRLEDETQSAHRHALRLAREGDHEGAAQRLEALDEHRFTTLETLASDRKELRQQQLDTTRERQDEACRCLIELRAYGFQEIKDRQKEERAEFKELQALREAGQPYDMARLHELIGDAAPEPAANDNRSAEQQFEAAQRNERGGGAFLADALPQDSGSPLFHSVLASAPAEPGPRRDAVDLATGGIAAAISLGINLLEGFVSSSSPLEQAQAKARAIRREEEAPVIAAALRDQKLRDDFNRRALAAVREAQAEQERDRTLDYEERGRSRQRER